MRYLFLLSLLPLLFAASCEQEPRPCIAECPSFSIPRLVDGNCECICDQNVPGSTSGGSGLINSGGGFCVHIDTYVAQLPNQNNLDTFGIRLSSGIVPPLFRFRSKIGGDIFGLPIVPSTYSNFSINRPRDSVVINNFPAPDGSFGRWAPENNLLSANRYRLQFEGVRRNTGSAPLDTMYATIRYIDDEGVEILPAVQFNMFRVN